MNTASFGILIGVKYTYDSHDQKGIILAGGSGSRLYPVTRAISKQLVPYTISHDLLPAVYAHASRGPEILVITTPHEQEAFRRLLKDGSWLGLRISYAVQTRPKGCRAFLIGKDFIVGTG